MNGGRVGPGAEREEWGGELGRYLIRHGSIFARAATLIALTVAVSNLLASEWLEESLLVYLRQFVAGLAARLFDLLGFDVTLGTGELQLSGGTVKIVNTCTGFDAGLFLAAAVLVFPTRWRARAAGVALVFGVMLGMNFLRVLSLAYLLTASRPLFDFFHYYLWPALIVMTCLATLLLWARRLILEPESAEPVLAEGQQRAGIAVLRGAPPLSHPWIAQLLLRFAAAYGVAFLLSAHVPVIEAAEAAGVRALDLGFRIASSAETTRSLTFVCEEGVWSYVYEVRLRGQPRGISQPFHAHGFLLLLYLALVLATPGLGWRRGSTCLVVGGGFVFALCVTLLMSDLRAWELKAFAGEASVLEADPFPAAICLADALHRTAAPVLLLVCLWVLYLTHGRLRQPGAEAS